MGYRRTPAMLLPVFLLSVVAAVPAPPCLAARNQSLVVASHSVARQVKTLKRQYLRNVRPALAAAELTGSVSDADSALQQYESWVKKVNRASKVVQKKLNSLRAAALALAANVYYQALREIGSVCPSNPTPQVYDSAQGALYGISGWVINAPQVDTFVAFMSRHRSWIGILEASLDDGELVAFKPCRPTGFKFEGLSYVEVDGQVTITETYTGEACGDDPYKVPWHITMNETIQGPGVSQTSSYTADILLNADSFVESAPDGVPYYGAFHIDSNASPPLMQMQVQPLKGYAEAGGTSAVDLVEGC